MHDIVPTHLLSYNIIVSYDIVPTQNHKTTKNAKLETILVHASFTDDHATSGKNCSSSSFESTPLISDSNVGISSISDTLLLRARDE